MSYVVQARGIQVGELSPSGEVIMSNTKISEQIAGQQAGGKKGGFAGGSVKVVYKFDKNRKANNDAIYKLWKNNPILQNRINQLNALVFGRGFDYSYEPATEEIVNRFWDLNRIRQKLNSIGTDAQLYGEVFIGLFPQANGDVLMSIYESNQVEIDFNPANVDDINRYIVSYKDEEKNKDEMVEFMPAYKYLNDIEFTNTTVGRTVRKIRKSIGRVSAQNVMVHLKFNNSSSEVHGTSDFRQVYGSLNEYMDFRSDRLAIHQMYGSPMFDIEIETEDDKYIEKRIEELADFTIGSNPVHNSKEKWKTLEFKNPADSAKHDESSMRGLISAGLNFPEHLVFNQGDESEGGTFAVNKLAEDRQDAFGNALVEIHKFVVAVAGGDIARVKEGQIVFPEISTMSEKAKAETYVLKVGANICSRQTAAYNTGHSWDIEQPRIEEEMQIFSLDEATIGRVGGRFSTRANNQDPDRDDGTQDRQDRLNAKNVTSSIMGDRDKVR